MAWGNIVAGLLDYFLEKRPALIRQAEIDAPERKRRQFLAEHWDDPLVQENPIIKGYGVPEGAYEAPEEISPGYRSKITQGQFDQMGGYKSGIPYLPNEVKEKMGLKANEDYSHYIERPEGVYGLTKGGKAALIPGVSGKREKPDFPPKWFIKPDGSYVTKSPGQTVPGDWKPLTTKTGVSDYNADETGTKEQGGEKPQRWQDQDTGKTYTVTDVNGFKKKYPRAKRIQ